MNKNKKTRIKSFQQTTKSAMIGTRLILQPGIEFSLDDGSKCTVGDKGLEIASPVVEADVTGNKKYRFTLRGLSVSCSVSTNVVRKHSAKIMKPTKPRESKAFYDLVNNTFYTNRLATVAVGLV